MGCDDRAWICERIEKTKCAIEAYEDAIVALSSGAQQYTLNTGQSVQMVRQAELSQLRQMLEMLESRLFGLQNRLCGGSRVVVIPGF